MTVAIRACQTKRRSMASKARRRFGPISPRRTAGSTTVVTIATPPIQITTASICSARAITTSFIGAVLMYRMLRAVVMFRVTNRLTEKPGSRATLTPLCDAPAGGSMGLHRPFRPGAPRALAGAPTPPTPKGYAQACRLQLPLLIESEDLRVACCHLGRGPWPVAKRCPESRGCCVLLLLCDIGLKEAAVLPRRETNRST